jgi:hypothetical protein
MRRVATSVDAMQQRSSRKNSPGAVLLLYPRFDRHAVHVAASRARDETRLVVDCSQTNALLSSGLPLDRAQKAEPASVEVRRTLLAG